MSAPTKDHYLRLQKWRPPKRGQIKLYVNRYFDNQLTLDKKLLDELDVFGAITWNELFNGALRNKSSARLRFSTSVINAKTRQLKFFLRHQLIDSETAMKYQSAIREWFDLKVGCGALAYRLVEEYLLKHLPITSKETGRCNDAVLLINPTARRRKSMAILADVSAVDGLLLSADKAGINLNIVTD